tara:strand:+ start:3687 stop:5198 length:1512 start_codon:yes stop_codon:yes gene_type:complete
MAILRYTASADNTITNAYEANLVTRGSGSNMGYADALEVFSIYGQESGSNGQSQELSRILIEFPINSVKADRTAGTIPASGSVSFYLKMFNAETPWTLPQDFTLTVAPVSRSWNEGTGLDMDNYQDLGTSNWMKANNSTSWTTIGGDYLTASNFNVLFPQGYENLELDVTSLVEQWITGSSGGGFDNYGFGVHLTASQEAYFSSSAGEPSSGSILQNVSGATETYYTKKFFARSTEFFFKRPVLEARWDSRLMDDRENFYYSSSRAPAADNLNSLYFYNYIRGRLVDYSANVAVSIYSSSFGTPTGSALTLSSPAATSVNATKVSTGIYKIEFAITGGATDPIAELNDVWSDAATGVQLYTGSVYPEVFPTYAAAPTFTKVTSCTNLQKSYSREDTARFRFFIRDKNWSPTIYTVATANNPTEIMPSASYSVTRVTDNLDAVPYGTGSNLSTLMSYDVDGNYFDLDMALLDDGYMYEIKLSYYNDSIGSWREQPQTFKFRVEE